MKREILNRILGRIQSQKENAKGNGKNSETPSSISYQNPFDEEFNVEAGGKRKMLSLSDSDETKESNFENILEYTFCSLSQHVNVKIEEQ